MNKSPAFFSYMDLSLFFLILEIINNVNEETIPTMLIMEIRVMFTFLRLVKTNSPLSGSCKYGATITTSITIVSTNNSPANIIEYASILSILCFLMRVGTRVEKSMALVRYMPIATRIIVSGTIYVALYENEYKSAAFDGIDKPTQTVAPEIT